MRSRKATIAVSVLLVVGVALIAYGEELTLQSTAQAARNSAQCLPGQLCSAATVNPLGGIVAATGALVAAAGAMLALYLLVTSLQRRRAAV